ncbi:amino acid/amide ABC transporter substrate-binding protein, HAAT family [Tistlia consotensis]|uniref:Branched-chain amino acid transport system substrate-binding protein n=1 Tax=Tistlia consotensis USBA 355 TaxID=560819 RepID=A0A1Y6CME5_9PROT|nr:branched-chain amino acid ABC transporter substrate-binding protein [Tistlia consotensis]SMF76137.1 branched-chain amino acid transport system substrate-binding protein [Tistlia consotensis USBA 355]SNS12314.1 amino acid/amide ABC transporter substrate-binding protein, HAAT family [Tistlia consotensis]
MKSLAAVAILSVGAALAVPAHADPLKIGIIESLSGAQTSTGRLFAAGVQYGVKDINAKGGFNGEPVEVVEYDNAGGSTGAADKFKQAVADGVNIVVQGASSAIAGQITEDVRKHNLRNPGKEIIFINVGAEAMALTGEKCHFYHFRYTTTAPMRVNALVKAMKAAGDLGTRVYSLNQNYSWGQDMQAAIEAAAPMGGYKVVGEVLHDVNKIQDFSPFVAKIKEANPDTVITGNWSNDLLLLMKATGDAGLKVRFGTAFLDQPGNIANAGETALGHYIANNYDNAAGDAAFAEDYKKVMGHYPLFVEPQTVFAMKSLQLALAKLDFHGGAIDTTKIALALEDTTYDSPVGPISVRKADHQTIRPVVVSKVVKDPKYPADGTDLGFAPVSVVPGAEAIYPVQSSCEMKRPS